VITCGFSRRPRSRSGEPVLSPSEVSIRFFEY
jgi:hypothetical protein